MKNLRKYLRKIRQKSLQDLLQVEAGRDCTSARHHNSRHNDNQPNDNECIN